MKGPKGRYLDFILGGYKTCGQMVKIDRKIHSPYRSASGTAA